MIARKKRQSTLQGTAIFPSSTQASSFSSSDKGVSSDENDYYIQSSSSSSSPVSVTEEKDNSIDSPRSNINSSPHQELTRGNSPEKFENSRHQDRLCSVKQNCIRKSFFIEDILRPEFGTTKNSDEEEPAKTSTKSPSSDKVLWPAWVYCTRYSDRPSAGPRIRRLKKKDKEDKRPRTAFSNEQLRMLTQEFDLDPYLVEKRRKVLSRDLQLSESQIKIWFQNKRAKMKKLTGQKSTLAVKLMAGGLYNHAGEKS